MGSCSETLNIDKTIIRDVKVSKSGQKANKKMHKHAQVCESNKKFENMFFCENCFFCENIFFCENVFNRPGVSGAVLQTPSLLID